MGRIIVFGATGYTGELAARALVARGAQPVLAGRNLDRVQSLATELGLDHAVADVEDPGTVTALVGPGDVLLSTVGPFERWGDPAVAAAVTAGAHYLDSTGEPTFIRRVFEQWGPRAKASNVALLTAMGYDYVPGNLAAALALADGGDRATAVDVGYFFSGRGTAASLSGGTRASLAGIMLEPSFAFRGGRIVTERNARAARTFRVDGADRTGVTVGGSEHFALPVDHPRLREVGVHLGWFGPVSRAMVAASAAGELVGRLPGVGNLWAKGAAALVKGSSGGPDEEARAGLRTVVVAEATDDAGRVVGRSRLDGPNPYTLTGDLLAWAAMELAAGRVRGAGALGPVTAFGLDALTDGAASCGLAREG